MVGDMCVFVVYECALLKRWVYVLRFDSCLSFFINHFFLITYSCAIVKYRQVIGIPISSKCATSVEE